MGRNIGFTAVHVEELAIGKARDAKTRMADEAERLAARLPDGAHIVLLDAKGKGMTSEDFAEMLGALRDAGTTRPGVCDRRAGRTGAAAGQESRAAAWPSGPRPGRICWRGRC